MRTLDEVKAERREDEVILKQNGNIIAEMTSEYALDLAEEITKHADKILLAHGNDN